MTVAFPDWPNAGPIDLSVHDAPHASSSTEWWYQHAHLETEDGGRLSLFAAFFRVAKPGKPGEPPAYGHSITWAITDLGNKIYYPYSGVDPTFPKMGVERIKAGRGAKDARVNRAMLEVLEKGHVPAPDRIFDHEVNVAITPGFASKRSPKGNTAYASTTRAKTSDATSSSSHGRAKGPCATETTAS